METKTHKESRALKSEKRNGRWRTISSKEKRPFLSVILDVAISVLISISALWAVAMVGVIGCIMLFANTPSIRNEEYRMAVLIVFGIVLVACILIMLISIITAKGADRLCCRERYIAMHAMALGLSPFVATFCTTNFIGSIEDIVLYLDIMLDGITLGRLLGTFLSFVVLNFIVFMLALIYNKMYVRKTDDKKVSQK